MSDLQTSLGAGKIVIGPVTRVEGHGKVTIRLNEAGVPRSGAIWWTKPSS